MGNPQVTTAAATATTDTATTATDHVAAATDSAHTTAAPAPWAQCFKVPGTQDPATLVLEQIDTRKFRLLSALEYVGATDVESVRVVDPVSLPTTDLTSVPGPFRWFVSPYGVHTPAALLHDRLVGPEAPNGFDRVKADRLFRHMLDCLGVPLVRRWLMWSAVAFGTRWAAGGLRRIAIGLWSAISLAGMALFAVGLVTLTPMLLVLALLAPFPASVLWGKQFVGGIVGAFVAPWLGLPTLIAAVGYAVYWVVERALGLLPLPKLGRPPASPQEF